MAVYLIPPLPDDFFSQLIFLTGCTCSDRRFRARSVTAGSASPAVATVSPATVPALRADADEVGTIVTAGSSPPSPAPVHCPR
ncbi:hypothetical protein GCM10022225_75600 [Plantactinospora mayteni]|uniref:Uncharacterized protein n=1 Tax=Plantactinospora mayteni TaxID=566021 RepID=A0ABQ4F213_9ACTN|nr:hypothetical protein Pma05_75170 [Plantactinospora mayteni]